MVADSRRGRMDRGSGSPRRIAVWFRFISQYAATAITAPSTISGTPTMWRPYRHAGERRQQLDNAEAGRDQCQRGPVPGQEGPLIRQRETRVRLGFGRRTGLAPARAGARRSSWLSTPSAARQPRRPGRARSRRRARARPPALAPSWHGRKAAPGTTSPRTGWTTRQAASTVSCRANRYRSPLSAAPISRSYGRII